MGPVYKTPEIEIPCNWHTEIPEFMHTESLEGVNWWEKLEDPSLNDLMTYAIAQNLDLKIAAMRVLQARAETKAKHGEGYPHIDGSMNYGHVYNGKDALVNGLLGSALPIESHHAKRHVNFYELGFDAEWEIDLFGMTAHEISALKANEEAVQEGLCDIWVTLSAEIAKNYIELRGHQQRLEILQRTIRIQEEGVQLTQELFERGVINDAEFSKAEAELSTIKALVPLMKLNIARTIHHLSILLGYPPGELSECLELTGPLPKSPDDQPIGVPSELLRRRPDIRKAERELASATEKIGSAIAALFPRFSLRGFVGEISTHTGSLFNPSSVTWFAGPQLLVPIFNSRLLLQEVQYNKVVTQKALYYYQNTVLKALEETENAIASYRHEEDRCRHLEDAYLKYKKSFEFAGQLYQNGVTDFLSEAVAEKNMLISEDAYLQCQVDILLHYVSLYKSLGGAW